VEREGGDTWPDTSSALAAIACTATGRRTVVDRRRRNASGVRVIANARVACRRGAATNDGVATRPRGTTAGDRGTPACARTLATGIALSIVALLTPCMNTSETGYEEPSLASWTCYEAPNRPPPTS
jgi:hypothetical protein